MAKITIIGSGMMGSALAFPARENGNEVTIVGTHLDREIINECIKTGKHPKLPYPFPSGIHFLQIEDLDISLKDVDFVICGVSSFGVEWFRDEIIKRLPENVPVISVTKGLFDTDEGELLTYTEIWNRKVKELGKNNIFCGIGGPCTSYELVYHDQTEVAFCGSDYSVLQMIKDCMKTDYYHISLTDDITGIESAVALKNSFALGIALTIGENKKKFGDDSVLHFNSQAAVFGESVREMIKLLELQGCNNSDNLSVGLGDLYVTVYGGRTRQIGILLGEGYNIDEAREKLSGVTLESLVVSERVARAVKILAKKGKAKLSDFPLLMCIDRILTEKQKAIIPWEDFTF